MSRRIRIQDAKAELDCQIELNDERAPRSAAALWALAAQGQAHDAIHAMWTGPEISCPVPASAFADPSVLTSLPLENATSFPEAGDIAVVYATEGAFKGQPDFAFFDIGLFYGAGARLFMPMGWVMASVCARVAAEDLERCRAGCLAIRRSGACRLTFSQVP
jgi:hypothetical protein